MKRSLARPLVSVLPWGVPVAVAVGVAVLAGSSADRRDDELPAWRLPGPPGCPPRAETVPAGADLQRRLDEARPHAVLALSPGSYAGPVVVRRPAVLWGPPTAEIRSPGQGTTIRVAADSVALLGFSVDGSGDRYDQLDAAVHVGGDDVRVEGLTVRNALFGIVAESSRRVSVIGNDIAGDATRPPGLRGDAIRFWETRESIIAANHAADARDIVVWYSPGNEVTGNLVEDSRYGTHFMYSSDSVVDGNRYLSNTVGVFVMYSRGIRIRDNLVAGATAANGMGIGCKESGNLEFEGNRFVKDRIGLYIDTSPLEKGDTNTVSGNDFALCQTAIVFHGSEERNRFLDNRLFDNRSQVLVEGRGNALGVTWLGNYFDDYRGYDFDGDGVGDVPYESRRLSDRLTARHPELQFFHGAIALALIDVAGQVFPLLQPTTLFRDPRPRMTAARPGADHAR